MRNLSARYCQLLMLVVLSLFSVSQISSFGEAMTAKVLHNNGNTTQITHYASSTITVAITISLTETLTVSNNASSSRFQSVWLWDPLFLFPTALCAIACVVLWTLLRLRRISPTYFAGLFPAVLSVACFVFLRSAVYDQQIQTVGTVVFAACAFLLHASVYITWTNRS
jgi:hypothetical protein